VTRVAEGRTAHQVLKLVLVVAAVLLLAGLLDAVLAQGNPFGAPKAPSGSAPPTPVPPATGVVGWIMTKQAEFYRSLSGLVRAAKTDGNAVWALFGLSFLYGVFHAAGPGHGKAVISSYMVANDETWWRGVVLSFASAILQAAVAVVFVGIAALVLKASASTMNYAVSWIEIASYSLIILIGLRLLWVKGHAFLRAWQTRNEDAAAAAAHDHHGHAHPEHAHHDHAHAAHDHGHAHDHSHAHAHALAAHDHDHAHAHAHHEHAHHDHDHHHDDHPHRADADHGHDHAHHGHDHHGHDHDHDDEASAWGHAHAPEPAELAGPGGWRRGLSAVIAVGLRPCSGAILVLVFALGLNIFWAGVVATFVMGIGTAITVAAIATIAVGAKSWAKRFASAQSGYGMLAMRGIEVAASLVIISFGTLLLLGYVASERMIGL
jgi:nickel/cobalt transporter (NicO) family protein